MKTARLVLILSTILILSMASVYVSGSETALSPGPPDAAGDGIPQGNPMIRPSDPPGMGHAPNSGDGVSDGSGF